MTLHVDVYLQIKLMVAHYLNAKAVKSGALMVTTDEVYILWFAETLQNWKAVARTSVLNGNYYEITYDGDNKEVFIDAYHLLETVRIPHTFKEVKGR